MPSFPFFRLPILVQILILKHVELLQLFEFSLCSKRSKNIAELLDSTLEKLHSMFDDSSNRHQEYLDRISVPPFPFFRLEASTQLLILKNASLLDLFYFSIMSKHSKQIVKSLGLTLTKMHWSLDRYLSCYRLNLNINGKKLSLYVDQNYKKGFVLFDKLNFNGTILPVEREEYGSWSSVKIQKRMSEIEILELLDQLTEHCLEVFHVTKYKLTFTNFSNYRSCFVWKHTRHFKTVKVVSWRSHLGLTREEAKFLLEELIIDKTLRIQCCIEEGFKYSGPLTMRKLHIGDGSCLTLEAVLNMSCQHLRLLNSSLSYKNLNEIVKEWLNGGLENLKEMKVEDYSSVNFNLDRCYTKLNQVLKGIDNFPWDAKIRPETTSEHNFRNGRDIQRGDLTVATVDWDREAFLFHVWPLK